MGGHSQRVGSRRQVWNGTAMETSGGLKRSDLFKDKYGNLKSRKASKKAKRSKNLKKAGYTAVKGKFGAVRMSGKPVKSRKASKKRKSSKKSRKAKRSSKKRGGSNHNHPRSRKVGGVHHNSPRRRKIKQMGGQQAAWDAAMADWDASDQDLAAWQTLRDARTAAIAGAGDGEDTSRWTLPAEPSATTTTTTATSGTGTNPNERLIPGSHTGDFTHTPGDDEMVDPTTGEWGHPTFSNTTADGDPASGRSRGLGLAAGSTVDGTHSGTITNADAAGEFITDSDGNLTNFAQVGANSDAVHSVTLGTESTVATRTGSGPAEDQAVQAVTGAPGIAYVSTETGGTTSTGR